MHYFSKNGIVFEEIPTSNFASGRGLQIQLY